MPRFLARRGGPANEAREARFQPKLLTAYKAFGLPEHLAVRADEASGTTEILVYDEIGYWGITAQDFVLALAKAGPGPLTVRINSPGGDAFDGLAIYNALKGHPGPVTVTVDGMAASAASIIAMAGANIVMNQASMMMIHNCWGVCIGNRIDMRACADIQQKIDSTMAAIYAAQMQKRGRDSSGVQALMDAETYFTSDEAKTAGLVDAVVDIVSPAATAALTVFPKAGIRAAIEPYDPDDDGDNDAQEALTLIQAAMALLNNAAAALTGSDGEVGDESGAEANDDDDGTAFPIVPGLKGPVSPQAAATPAEWVVGADRDLPIDDKTSWDGPGAAERMLAEAGFNGDSPDPGKAKRGFLAWDHHNPKEKGSYKLPFADMVSGELTALKSGIDAAASRLPQTDIPPDVRTSAKAVLDAYESRMSDKSGKTATDSLLRRLRLAEVEI